MTMISLEQTVSRAIRRAPPSAQRASDRARARVRLTHPLAAADTLMTYRRPETMLGTRRGGVVGLPTRGRNRWGVRRRALAYLAFVLLAGLAARAPTATAAARASDGPLASNPFAAGDAAVALTSSANPDTSPAPPTRYEEAVLADKPTLYLPLTETSGTTAFDHSGNGLDGTYDLGVTHEGSGPLLDEPNVAVFGEGQVVTQSGDKLPSGSKPRTLEFWVHNVASENLTLARYGDIEGGHGFAVTLHTGTLTVEANGHTVSANTIDGFGHWCCDGTGWHMVDVTYDEKTAEIYQDGQLIGGGTLTEVETTLPGQGLRFAASFNGCCGGAAPYGFAEAAIYPTPLSPEQIGAHWSAGASLHEEPTCAPTPSGPYPKAVLEDSPLIYYRLGERTAYPTDRVAFDSSGHCYNGTFDLGTTSGGGALPGDEDASIFGEGQVVFQSGDKLPSGSKSRTLEFWVHNVASENLTLARYGDIEGGHGFAVTLHTGTLTVEANGHSVSANTIDGFGHWCCDGTGWHMVDVTYGENTAEIYQDGQLIGGGALPEVETKVLGQGLRFAASFNGCCGGAAPYGFDEAAVYPAALSSARIVAHWEAASQPPEGESVIGGTATNGFGGRVQACPTSGGACIVDPHGVDTSGAFHMIVPNGTYTVTIFPPAGSSSGPRIIGPVTLPPSVLNLTASFSPPGALPEGVTFDGQENIVPTVFWGNPSTLTVKGCKEGFGAVFVHATNTSTGQPETRVAAMTETPEGSGSYIAHIPPLAPLHGQASASQSVACAGRVLPDGGPPTGETRVLLSGGGLTGVTGVSFGSTPAASFAVISGGFVTAVAPPGPAGATVPVKVVTTEGTTEVGTYSYFDVTGVETTEGPMEGGNTVTIHGHGLSHATGVVFGLALSPSVTVVSDGEIQAHAPAGVGKVDIQVLTGFALSQAAPSSTYTYLGGPPGSASVDEGFGTDAPYRLAAQMTLPCNEASSPDNPIPALGDACNNVQDQLTSPTGAGPLGVIVLGSATLAAATLCAVSLPVCALGVGLGIVGYFVLRDHCGPGSHCPFGIKIDPSGTIADTSGNPLSGATATLLEQLSEGEAFSPVPPLSGAIEPAVNPETTGPSGGFDWEALAGTYEVEASAPNCHTPGDASEASVFTSPFVIPPPAVGLTLTLECPGSTAPTPSVTALSPASGPTAGGNTVDVIGEGLVSTTGVKFGGTPATYFRVLSPYAVAAVVPAGTATASVTVTTKGGTSKVSETAMYSYVAPLVTPESPVVSSVTPGSGPESGGTLVTIKGNNLVGAYAVDFGSTPSSRVTPISSTEVQAVAPAPAFPVRADVSVTTPNGTSAPTVADGFVYGSPPPPVATSVTLSATPNPVVSGQPVTITAAVAPTDGAGSVAFYADGSSTPMSNCATQALTRVGSSYQATCSTTSLAVGGHTLSAAYSGDASYAGSSGSTNVSVENPPKPTGGGSTTGSGGSSNTQTGTRTTTSTAASGSVSLAGSTITVQGSGAAAIKLTCTGTGTCSGKLTLTAKRTTKKGKKKHTKTQTIGTATFSISASKTATIKIALNAIGRALLSAAHGHLSARLTILKSSPSPAATQTANVHLALQKATNTKKGKK
jgi:hypothetical protein